MSSYKEDLERAEQDYGEVERALMEVAEQASKLRKENKDLRARLTHYEELVATARRWKISLKANKDYLNAYEADLVKALEKIDD